MKSIYLIGSLRNQKIPLLGVELRKMGYDVFDDWHGAGPEADVEWRKYELLRGRTYRDALHGYAAGNTFSFDYRNIQRCDIGILILPAGKSGHLELGYMLGQGKRGYVLFDEIPKRWDLMYRFAADIFFNQQGLFDALRGFYGDKP